MTPFKFQSERRALYEYRVWKREYRNDTYELELHARVVRDDKLDLWFVEWVRWTVDGHEWDRARRGYATHKGALLVAERPRMDLS